MTKQVIDEVKDKIGFSWQVFSSVNNWIVVADAKAFALLATNGVLAGVVLNNSSEIIAQTSQSACAFFFLIISFISFLTSMFFGLQCILPRLHLKTLSDICKPAVSSDENASPLYFYHVANSSLQDYSQNLRKALNSEDIILDEITNQIWNNSKVASQKHKDAGRALWAFALTITFGLIALIFTW